MYCLVSVDRNDVVQSFRPDVTVQGCKKCWVSSAVDGTGDDMLWNVRSECEGDSDSDSDC
jgi:hypothetical protein